MATPAYCPPTTARRWPGSCSGTGITWRELPHEVAGPVSDPAPSRPASDGEYRSKPRQRAHGFAVEAGGAGRVRSVPRSGDQHERARGVPGDLGLVPTPFARRSAAKLKALLDAAAEFRVAPEGNDPRPWRRTFARGRRRSGWPCVRTPIPRRRTQARRSAWSYARQRGLRDAAARGEKSCGRYCCTPEPRLLA